MFIHHVHLLCSFTMFIYYGLAIYYGFTMSIYQATQRLAPVALFQVQDEGQTAHAETLDIERGVGPWSLLGL